MYLVLESNMDIELKKELAGYLKSDKVSAGRRLSAVRRMVGLTQEELAAKVGNKKASISNTERGDSHPSAELMHSLLDEYRVDPNFIVVGQFAQLPGDVQDAIFEYLADPKKKALRPANSS
jgi:transcriptional regulator with XRE-family HTH domain